MNTTSRMIGALVAAAALHAAPAAAQSVAGRWDGTVTTQQGPQNVTLTFDSTAAGWQGTATSDMAGSVPLFNIALKGDTVSFALSVQSMTISMAGALTADRKTLNGYLWMDGADAGTFKFMHAAPAAPAKPPTR